MGDEKVTDNSEVAGPVTKEPIAQIESEAIPAVRKPKTGQSRKKVRAETRSKKYQVAKELVEKTRDYKILEAVELAQKSSYSKFPGTLEAHINTNSKGLRGLISLPYLSGKELTILAFGKEADKSGSDLVGTEETIKDILKGIINFDVLVTTPEWMPKLAPTARILGPRGLMPNPKSGTISDNLKKAVEELQSGKVEYKTEPNGQVIHLPIGKGNQTASEIEANIQVLYQTIGKSRIKKITLASSMGPGVRVDLSSI